MIWEQIKKVNEEIKTTELKGKQYAEVKERVIAFRKLYPMGLIETEMITYTKEEVIFKATAKDETGKVLANGFAREKANKIFSLENCETSAIGRCLGFLGLGISTSIASADEMKNVEQSEIFDEPTPADIKALAEQFKKLYTKEEQVRILNGLKITDPEQIGYNDLQKYIAFKQNEIKTDKGKGNQPTN